MPNKPSLVINTNPLVALAAALDDFRVLDDAVTLIVPGEVIAELEAGAERDDTAKAIRAARCCSIRAPFAALPAALEKGLGRGEAAVIHTTLNERLTTAAIDERKGRRIAGRPQGSGSHRMTADWSSRFEPVK